MAEETASSGGSFWGDAIMSLQGKIDAHTDGLAEGLSALKTNVAGTIDVVKQTIAADRVDVACLDARRGELILNLESLPRPPIRLREHIENAIQ